jgi:hypothetical protein
MIVKLTIVNKSEADCRLPWSPRFGNSVRGRVPGEAVTCFNCIQLIQTPILFEFLSFNCSFKLTHFRAGVRKLINPSKIVILPLKPVAIKIGKSNVVN